MASSIEIIFLCNILAVSLHGTFWRYLQWILNRNVLRINCFSGLLNYANQEIEDLFQIFSFRIFFNIFILNKMDMRLSEMFTNFSNIVTSFTRKLITAIQTL